MLPELTARLVHQDITPAPASRLVLARQTICGLAAALPGRDIHVVADAVGGFEDPQAQQAEHGHEGEIVPVGGLAGGGEQGLELQVREAERR